MKVVLRFVKLKLEHLDFVLEWRSSTEISKYMLTDVEKNMQKQLQWFQQIEVREDSKHWVIYFGDIAIGLINLAQMDFLGKQCSAGYYIADLNYRGLGAEIPPFLYNYVFNIMGFEKIYGTVLASNKGVLEIHKLHGYREVDRIKHFSVKNGQPQYVIMVELLKSDWLEKKRYHDYIADFD